MSVSTYVGQVVRKNSLWKAVRVRVQKMKMDKFLTMYFNKRYHYWATDPEDKCKEGDIVLIKLQDEPQSARVKHTLKEIIFPVGATVDPITGRRCRGTEFVDIEAAEKCGPAFTEAKKQKQSS
ncbi:28S ribosomal protein S17, mitochondrial [Lamellibrachia satsuma]|nr:28S ribosomal protein S17, mitochondrial [Lamellibrachia satsuma]